MTLNDARLQFAACVGLLIHYAAARRIPLRLEETLRSPEAARWNAEHCRAQLANGRCERVAADPIHASSLPQSHRFSPIGIADSVHCLGLAVDVLVIEGGKPSNYRGAYEPLGSHWKTLHEFARWGGDFNGGRGWDLGHFSFEWQGRK